MIRMHLLSPTNEYLGYLGAAAERSYLAELNGVGAGRFVLSAADPTAAVVAPQQIVRVDVGNSTVGHWIVEKIEEVLISEGDASGHVLTVSGRGLLATLEKALVYAFGYPIEPGTAQELAFWPSFGAGWFGVLNGAVDLPFDFGFDTADDSNKEPWPEDIDTSVKCNASMLDVFQTMAALGIEMMLEPGDTTMLAAPHLGEDRTEEVIFRQGRDVQYLKCTRYSGDLANAVMAIEGPASYVPYTDAASIAAYGRLEAAIDTSTKTDAAKRAMALLELLRAPAVMWDVAVNTATFVPFADYGLGDDVQLWTNRVRETFRVRAIEISQNEREEIQVRLQLDDRVMTYMEALQAALRRAALRPARRRGLED